MQKNRLLFPALCAVLGTFAVGCGDDSGGAKVPGTTTTSTTGSTTGAVTVPMPPGSGGGGTSPGVDTTGSVPGVGTGSTAPVPNPTSGPGGTTTTGDGSTSTDPAQQDFVWLEDPSDPRVGPWVKNTNSQSRPLIEALPGFEDTRVKMLNMANFEPFNQIPAVSKIGNHLYNFYADAAHPFGLWQRTTLEKFKARNPEWEPVLDVSALSAAENEQWLWTNPNCFLPTGDRCMVTLYRAGQPTGLTREFDTQTKTFVDDGFVFSDSVFSVSWIDRNNVYVAANFGADSMTTTGQPRTVRKWTRGTDIKTAPVVFEVQPTDNFVNVSSIASGGVTRTLATRGVTFAKREYFLLKDDGTQVKLDVPLNSAVGYWGVWMLVRLGDSDWSIGGQTWEGGSVLVIDEAAFLAGQRNFERLYAPGPRSSLTAIEMTKELVLIAEMENNRARLYEWSPGGAGEGWSRRAVELPQFGSLNIKAYDHHTSDQYFLTFTDFVTPPQLFLAQGKTNARELIWGTLPYFDNTDLEITQYFATSKDGTKVPYFQISKKGMALDGKNPTIVFGYGGFNVSLSPAYRGGVGIGWLERGGVYVVANIRGGGEFGPNWHKAALKENRQRSFDDFIAVGEDLVARQVTSSAHMGVHGDGNGGLVAGVMHTQRPDLWGAVIAQNPVLDMQRFHVIPGGAGWITEYGNPGRPVELEYLLAYSPFHQVKRDTAYPPLLLTTPLAQPPVHQSHARKMMARMTEQGHTNVLFYESTDTDQGGATPNERRAYNASLIYSFFAKELGLNKSR